MGGSLSRQREKPFADADGGSRRTQRLLGDARWRNSLHAHQPYEKKEKEWERQSIDVCSTAQSGNEPSRARRTMSYYAGNVTAEMATVLRRNATILIRLREKMEVQFSLDSLDTNVSNHA